MGTKTTLAKGTRIAATYGEIEVLAFDGAWRLELYRPADGSKPVHERAMHGGSDDASPRHAIYGSYDAKCACCWLNITHTERKHALATSEGR